MGVGAEADCMRRGLGERGQSRLQEARVGGGGAGADCMRRTEGEGPELIA